ncbi:MAG: flagellar hook-basal body complex protein FliE [Pseudomonadales bacterium]|nr:flagellar hook-basal body complex protein FliE [Pseudomonadales bacterium]
MTATNIDQVLNQMRILSQSHQLQGVQETNGPQFANVLKESLNQVSELQQEASAMKTAFETGDPDVDITEVMIAVEKASLSFEAITEVRNKLLTAYQEVMNMQV